VDYWRNGEPFTRCVAGVRFGGGYPFLYDAGDLTWLQLWHGGDKSCLVDPRRKCFRSCDLVGIDPFLQQPLHFGKIVAPFLERDKRDALPPELDNDIVALDQLAPEFVDFALRRRTCRLRQELCQPRIFLDGLDDRPVG